MAEESDSEIMLSPKLESLSEEYAKDPTSRKFYPLAEEYRKSGMLEEAIYICKEGLKNHPNYMPALMTLAHCYVETKNYTEGLPLLQEILEKGPENAAAHRLAGDLYFSQGEINSAQKHYLSAQKLLPDDRVSAERLQIIGFPETDLTSDRAIDVSTTTGEQDFELTKRGEPIAAPSDAKEYPGMGMNGGGSDDDGEAELDLDEADEHIDVALTLGDEGESVDLFVPTQRRVAAVEEPDEPEPSDVDSEDAVFSTEVESSNIKPSEEAEEKVEEQFRVGESIEVGDGEAAAFPEPMLEDEVSGEPLLPGDEIEPLEIPPVETEEVVEEDKVSVLESSGETRERFDSASMQEGAEEEIGVPGGAERELSVDEIALVQELESLSPQELQEVPLEELVLREGDIVERGVAPATEVAAEGIADSALEIEAEEEPLEAPLEAAVEPVEAGVQEAPVESMEPPAVDEPFLVEPVEFGDLDVKEPVAAEPEETEREEELPATPTITSARVYEEQGHLTEALEIYRWLIERDPDNKHLESKVIELESRLEGEKASSVDYVQRRKLETLSRWLRNIEAFEGGRKIREA